MRLLKAFLLLSVLLVHPFAQAGTVVQHYTIRDGLSDSSPRCLVQDADGVLWIGSWNGVDRFDGRSFRAVERDGGESFGTTLGLAGAEDGSCWICDGNGISRVSPHGSGVRSFRIGYDKAPQTIDAFSMDISASGDVFCSAIRWGICRYNPDTDEMVPFNIVGVNTGDIHQVLCLGADYLLLLKESGELDAVQYAFRDGVIDAEKADSVLPAGVVSGLFKVEGGAAVVTEEGMLYVLDEASLAVIQRVRLPESTFSAGAGKPGEPVAALAFRNSTTVEVDLASGTVREIGALSGRYVGCLLYGTEDILWAGVNSGGLMAVIQRDSGMDRFLSRDLFGESVGTVSSFFERDNGEILVATEGNGIASLRPDGTLGRTIGKAEGLCNMKVYELAPGIGNDVFAGGEGKGIDILSGGRVRSLLTSDERVDNVYTICRDDERDCWYLGIYGRGIARLRARRDASGNYVVTEFKDWFSDDPDAFSAKMVMDIVVTKDGKLVVGTLSEGCLVFDLEEERFLEQRLCPNAVLCLFGENDRSLWIGTAGDGLLHVTMEEGAGGRLQTGTYSRDHGLRDLSIHGILQDASGKIWVSTNLGLACLDPKEGTAASFYDTDDLQSNEFSNSSCLALSDGTFLFGGVEGFNRFDPLKLRKREFEPEILFTSFTLILDPGRTIPCRGDIVLRHDENYFSIAYSAVEFIGNDNCEYAYRLAGFDEQWISQEKAAPVTYSNLHPGKYRFEVRCTNGDKRWSDRTASLDITIRRPWWGTGWAFLLYAALLSALGYGISVLVRRRMRRKREMEMEMLRKEHEHETYEAKLRFFTNLAHEFGTPLTLISGAGEQLLDHCHMESRPTRYVQIIKDNADRMQRLIKELMDFRKVDTGNYTPTYSRFDLVPMIRRVFDAYAAEAEKGGIRPTLSVPDAPLWIVSDFSALEKILHNLISNAYKYTPENGRIEVSLLPEGTDEVRIRVSNSGKGIQPEDLPNVFDRFVVLENLESEAKSGRIVRNGVGLALVHSLVRTLGGSVSVSSEPKKWTEFSVLLPLSPEGVELSETAPAPSSFFSLEPDTAPDQPALPVRKETVKTGRKVLVVDDEKPIRDLVCEILSDRYEVLQASNGKEAVTLISYGLPDLVITDISMPEMSGIELCRYLKENEITRHIPIVFLSFLTDIQSEIGSYETGGDAFIPKPFHPRHLTAVVNKILSERESLKSYYSSVMSNTDILNEKVMLKSDREFIVKLSGIVESDLSNEALSPAILSERMHISRAQLYRKLNELVGLSPVEFIRSIRLEHAAHLLKTTALTVQEIMYEVGFNNKSYFYREFGKVFGQSPKAYRTRAQAQDHA